MNRIQAFLFNLAAALLVAGGIALAQTAPNWTQGQVPTTAQWNAVFAGKQDYLGSPPCLTVGCTMLGKLVSAASTTAIAGLNVPSGIAPTSPINGDLWTTGSGLFARINGITVPVASAGGATGRLAFTASVNFNAGATDTTVPIVIPATFARYMVPVVMISGASASISTATVGVFGAAGGAAPTIAATQAITVTSAAENTNNNAMSLTLTNSATESYTLTTLYVRVGTAQGSAATATVTIYIAPLS